MPTKAKPTFILGFDGLSPTYFMDEECFCHPGEHQGILPSVDPLLSQPAWTSLLTGVLPEESGITKQDPSISLLNSKVPPLWRRKNITFALYNVPCIRPIPPHPRVVEFVGGLYWREKDAFTRPASIRDALLARGYTPDIESIAKKVYADMGIVDCTTCDAPCCIFCPRAGGGKRAEEIREFNKRTSGEWYLGAVLENATRRRELRMETDAEITILVYVFPDRLWHRGHAGNPIVENRIHAAVFQEAQYWLKDRGFNDTHNWIILSDHGFRARRPKPSGHIKNGIWASNKFNLLGCCIADVIPAALEQS